MIVNVLWKMVMDVIGSIARVGYWQYNIAIYWQYQYIGYCNITSEKQYLTMKCLRNVCMNNVPIFANILPILIAKMPQVGTGGPFSGTFGPRKKFFKGYFYQKSPFWDRTSGDLCVPGTRLRRTCGPRAHPVRAGQTT